MLESNQLNFPNFFFAPVRFNGFRVFTGLSSDRFDGNAQYRLQLHSTVCITIGVRSSSARPHCSWMWYPLLKSGRPTDGTTTWDWPSPVEPRVRPPWWKSSRPRFRSSNSGYAITQTYRLIWNWKAFPSNTFFNMHPINPRQWRSSIPQDVILYLIV